MADVVVNIPISATDSTNWNLDWQRDVIWLNSNSNTNKFICIYEQNAPNRTYACIFKVDNIKTANPTATILRNQVMLDFQLISGAVQGVYRLVKLTDTQVLCFRSRFSSSTSNYLTEVAILEIDDTTNVITRVNTNSLSFSHSYLLAGGVSLASQSRNPFRGNDYYNGTQINQYGSLNIVTYKKINSSVILASIPTYNGVTGNSILKLTWNNQTKNISLINMVTLSGANGYAFFTDHLDDSGISIFSYAGFYNGYTGTTATARLDARVTISSQDIQNINNINSFISSSAMPSQAQQSTRPYIVIEDSTLKNIAILNSSQYVRYVNSFSAVLSTSTFSGVSTSSINNPVATNIIKLDNSVVMIITNGDVTILQTASSGSWGWGANTRVRVLNVKDLAITPTTSDTIEYTNFTPTKYSLAEKISDSIVVMYGMKPGPNAITNTLCVLQFLYIQ